MFTKADLPQPHGTICYATLAYDKIPVINSYTCNQRLTD